MNPIQRLLCKLAEECCEVGQRCMKAAFFGVLEKQTIDHPHNGYRLREELMDLVVMIDILVENRIIDAPILNPAEHQLRRARVLKYLALSEEKGQVNFDGWSTPIVQQLRAYQKAKLMETHSYTCPEPKCRKRFKTPLLSTIKFDDGVSRGKPMECCPHCHYSFHIDHLTLTPDPTP